MTEASFVDRHVWDSHSINYLEPLQTTSLSTVMVYGAARLGIRPTSIRAGGVELVVIRFTGTEMAVASSRLVPLVS